MHTTYNTSPAQKRHKARVLVGGAGAGGAADISESIHLGLLIKDYFHGSLPFQPQRLLAQRASQYKKIDICNCQV